MTPTKTAAKAHIALHVRDLARSLDFYRKLFDAEPVKLRRDYAKFDLSETALNFTLNQAPAGESPAASRGEQRTLSHLGIQVASSEEVLAVRERWGRAGLDTRDENKTWVRDPDGNEWEVFVVFEDHLPEKPAEPSACCAPTCCAPAGA
jgi:catechol 2,3-dioxygenase-like lactoylglutathione lyase family enzyme